jgi:ribosome-associated protein
MIKKKLNTRLTKDGTLQLSSHRFRSQLSNREEVVTRFIEILRKVFRKKTRRIKTKMPKEVKERRLEEKKKLSRKKQLRRKDISWD